MSNVLVLKATLVIMKNHTNSIMNLKEGVISVKTEEKRFNFLVQLELLISILISTDDIPDKVLLLVENAQELEK